MITKRILFLLATFIHFGMDAQWQAINDMGYGRSGHAAVSFINGDGIPKLIVTGGYDGNSGLASAEVFDEASETWDNLPDMEAVRMDHTADLFGDQKMILIGGWDGASTNWESTEILEENAGSYEFSAGPDMASPRSYHETARYEPDYLLVIGGYDGFVNLASCEKLNTITMEFEAMASMNYGRSSFTVTRLANGHQFLVTGGFNPDFGFQMNQCEIYDALNNTWTPVASLHYARDNHAAILLPDNRVLVAGGRYFNSDLNLFEGMVECEIYDPLTDEWTVVQSTSGKHSYHELFLLNDQVLLPGGTDQSGFGVDLTYSNTEIFDLATDSWSDGGITVPGRYQYAGGETLNGVVVCGGLSTQAVSGEIYYYPSLVQEATKSKIHVYPTLVHTGNTIRISGAGLNASVDVYDTTGRRIRSLNGGIQTFPADFSPGAYTLIFHDLLPGKDQQVKIVVTD